MDKMSQNRLRPLRTVTVRETNYFCCNRTGVNVDSTQLLLWPSSTHTHKHQQSHTHTYPEPGRVPEHLISFPSSCGEKTQVSQMLPFPAEASGNSQSTWLLPSLPPVPYHSHSLHISSTPLTPSFFPTAPPPPLLSRPPLLFAPFLLLPFCSLIWSFFPPCPASAQCTSIIQRQSTGFSGLSNQSRGSALNGLLLYLLPAPAHS